MSAPLIDAYRGRRVLLTGHSGFKGSWMTLWLNRLGAVTTGFANGIPTTPAMFELCGLSRLLDHRIGDVRDRAALARLFDDIRPEIIFHFAAQPLVRLSYEQPEDTFATNANGTVNLLEAIRQTGRPCTVVVITSDKCYHNDGRRTGYRETDPMGGADPYSMSKGVAELIVASWRRSFFGPQSGVRLASARAGNVIGGGDWAQDRIVTDSIRSLIAGEPVPVRNPLATRPWQHVLEPLSGYLWLGARLMDDATLADAWNFGPSSDSVQTVEQLVETLIEQWGSGRWQMAADAAAPHEAMSLSLDCGKAHELLDWRPVWGFVDAIAQTVDWFRCWRDDVSGLRHCSERQIERYEAAAATLGQPWAPAALAG